MSSTFFISDLHLEDARPAVTRALAGFLESHTDCRSLYILGDLFEAWPGDDDDSGLAAEIAGLLRSFHAAGPELFIMPGNRDLLLGQDFCDRTGAQLLTDPSLIDLYGEPTLLMHGDTLCTADVDYQQFRETARSPAWQAEVAGRSLAQRRELAARLRNLSREAKGSKARQMMDAVPAEVERVMQHHGVSQLIHGHTHRPGRHDGPAGTRWVLGEWAAQGWVLAAGINNISLTKFNIIQ